MEIKTVFVCLLTGDSVKGFTVFDLVNMVKQYPGANFCLINGTYIEESRNTAAEAVLNSNADYLMFVDSDMRFPSNSIERLLDRDVDIVGANYKSKRMQEIWTARKNNRCVASEGKTGMEDVDFVGAGLLLIKRNVLEKIGKPYFPRIWVGSLYEGEDVGFCRRAREEGYKVYVDHDISQEVRHIGNIELGIMNIQNPEYKESGIDGWMSTSELNFLYQKAKGMSSICEIGCWKGRTTHALASACKNVTAVDHFKGSKEDISGNIAKTENVREIFEKNMKGMGVKLIAKSSKEAVKKVGDFDMVFLDAGHDYKSIKEDIKLWLPKTKKFICGHDYDLGFPETIRAVNEVFGKPDGVTGSIWYKEIK